MNQRLHGNGDRRSNLLDGGANSESASSQLLREVINSDSASGTDRDQHRYNRQGEVIETTDQNSTEHAFNYDRFGRRT